ncbi:L-glyceraldehyde 3-phosphate reductase [Puniceicoccus vermicola]|uniref:L-glyceraldehyde 3-phosphate reductase n=1 Tax=Puniceicoccus vermicola TaxID=388746 RepID=A0A7X1B0V6_9BACT|nr:L-glyceraldehyde 3-phosphate reductase [Puniceicoccus vermicola]MBC2603566.1 L-glyceraldehyde 3-phosphate reductase [Puniceicoccus vermicola]
MSYTPKKDRYESVPYERCGRSGLKLPKISLGLWHNFGDVDNFENARSMIQCAFDHGITHFDLANNYGPSAGSAERNFGKILSTDLAGYRDELIISTKAGYHMWEGPYGDWGSRKYLLSSLDQSLLRMGVDYVDIFYSHRPDPETPMEETMGALDQAVRSGKALYAGISSYNPEQTRLAARILRDLGTPCIIHQPSYSILNRWVEDGLLDALEEEGIGGIAFCPLAQGMLTDRYLEGVPEDSRAANPNGFLKSGAVKENIETIRKLAKIAERRGQSLAQMALSWVLRQPGITSALIGASRTDQILDNLGAAKAPPFSEDELHDIDEACGVKR